MSTNVVLNNQAQELYALAGIPSGTELVIQNIGQETVALSNGVLTPTDVELTIDAGGLARVAAGTSAVWAKQYRGAQTTALLSVRTRAQFDALKPFTGLDEGPAGPTGGPGPQGPAGDGSTFNKTADINLSGHRAVRAVSADRVSYVSSDDVAQMGMAIAITTGSALADATVNLRAYGEIAEPSWAWVAGPVFLGVNGVLTQTVPSTGYVQRIGIALSSTKMQVAIAPPIKLG